MGFVQNYFNFEKNSIIPIKPLEKIKKKVIEKRTRSIELTIFLMRALGLWHPSGRLEEISSKVLLNGSLIMVIYDVYSQTKDVYESRNNFTKLAFAAPLASLAATEMLKMIIFIINREKVMKINKFVNENFWMKNYNYEETIIFNHYDKLCTIVITAFVILGQCVCWHYLLLPVFEENTTGIRKLPFTIPIKSCIWYETPYYELYYFTMLLGAMSLFFCTVTFASYLFSVSLLVAAQFKMLSNDLSKLCDFENQSDCEIKIKCQLQAFDKLKECIRKHQMLISLTKEFENLYCYILLGQMIGSVTEICFCGLQILLDTTAPQRNILSLNLLLSCSLQLYLFCFSSHEVYLASENVARAVYSMKWIRMTDPRVHKHFSLSIQIIAHRARRPCILSVGKFYPLTLETFASVLGSSISYFMVLRELI